MTMTTPRVEHWNKQYLLFFTDNQALPPLNWKQMYLFWNNPTFIYTDLLPYGGFYERKDEKKDRSRIKFLTSEDK